MSALRRALLYRGLDNLELGICGGIFRYIEYTLCEIKYIGYNNISEYSVSNHVEVSESRFMSACFDLENEYKAVL